jgi:predicted ATPase/DNA-binding SARP family transcriptional activator/class 3 adenylate cyclase
MSELPSGTVTFLFTDVEGSTRLLKQLRDGYGEVLFAHQRLLLKAFERRGGHVVDTQGDSFFVAFARVSDAVGAARQAQADLAAHPWPKGSEVRVRMGIHTAEPIVGGGRYVGLGVHRAARICSAGHGGQVLLSQTTRELLRDEPMDGVAMRDLGEVRLKDIDGPERIFQLLAPGLEQEFPPLKGDRVPGRGLLKYRLLGPLEVHDGDRVPALGGAKQRALLALLLLNANRVVSRERIIDGLWGEEPPETAVATVQVYVSRLRKLLGPGALVTRPPGYLFAAELESIDVFRFERLVAEGRQALAGGDSERAARALREALALWRGPALGEFEEPFARVEGGRLDYLRVAAVEERIEADLALGRQADLIGELEGLIAEHPHRERLRAQLMLALYRSGRQAEALAAYRDARAALDELGLEPGEQLRALEKQILTQDRALAPVVQKTNLPAEPTPLVGRTQELSEVRALLSARKLLTLTGAGGAGKTRLALEAARSLLAEFHDGVWFVSLAAVSDPELVEPTISQVLGAHGDLNAFLRGKRLLLLLDNLEQLLPDVAPTVARLETTVLATSRERLNVAGEQEYPVPTLPLEDAVQLFTQRARQVEPRFEPDEHVPKIARRLDGLPLALELAAARVKALSPQQIAERLGHSLDLLIGGARDAPERQRTLRATLEWSYQLLDEQEQALFARLAVFAGGCTLEAAEQIAGATLEGLQSLVDKNLLRHSQERFGMLETVRELALEKLEPREDAEQLRHRHAEYLLEFLRTSETELVDAARVTRESAESDNLRAAIEWAIGGKHVDLALSLASHDYGPSITSRDTARWLDLALPLGEHADPNAYATALARAAWAHNVLGDLERAETLAQSSLDQFVALRNRVGQCRALLGLGLAAIARGDIDRARERLTQSLELAEVHGTANDRYAALHNLGELERDAGNLDRASVLLEQARQLALDDGNNAYSAAIEHGLGDTALAAGDTAAAEQHYRSAIGLAQGLGALRTYAYCLAGLASAAASRGECERAGRLWGASEAFRRAMEIDPHAFEGTLYEEALARVAGPQFEHAANATRHAEPNDALAAALAND